MSQKHFATVHAHHRLCVSLPILKPRSRGSLMPFRHLSTVRKYRSAYMYKYGNKNVLVACGISMDKSESNVPILKEQGKHS